MAIVLFPANNSGQIAFDMTKAGSQVAVLALESYANYTEFPVAGVTFVDANAVSHNLTQGEIVSLLHAVRAGSTITIATTV